MNRFPMRERGRFPFFRCWLHRSFMRMEGWEFGFYFAPWPKEEHTEGGMIRAMVHFDGFICFKPWRWRAYLGCADASERPVGHNAPDILAEIERLTSQPSLTTTDIGGE